MKSLVSIFPVAFFYAVLIAIPMSLMSRMAANREFRPAQMINIDSALTLVGLLGMFVVFALITFHRRVAALEKRGDRPEAVVLNIQEIRLAALLLPAHSFRIAKRQEQPLYHISSAPNSSPDFLSHPKGAAQQVTIETCRLPCCRGHLLKFMSAQFFAFFQYVC